MSGIQFGVRLPVSGPLASIIGITEIASRAEGLGYDSIWVHDHLTWTKEAHEHHISSGSSEALGKGQDPLFFESLTTLSYLAALTKQVKLGVACMVMPCRNPIYLAKQAANLDALSKGRLILGAGLGSRTTRLSREFETLGVPVKTRGERFTEYVKAMKTLWTEKSASFSGKYVSFKDVELYPKPVQKPNIPIWVGGWSKGSVERAVEVGDGWIPGWNTPDEMAEKVTYLKENLSKSGRDPNRFTVAVEKYLCISKNREEALKKAMDTVTQSRETYERQLDDVEFAKAVHVFGDVADVSNQIERFVKAGVTHFEFKFIYSSIAELYEMMELFSDKIMSTYR